MSLILLAIGGLSPLLGGLLQKVSVRSAMIGGAALSALGYWGLALLPSFSLALVMFGLIGTGVCLMGILGRSEEHTSELQSLMRISYAVFCLNKKTTTTS